MLKGVKFIMTNGTKHSLKNLILDFARCVYQNQKELDNGNKEAADAFKKEGNGYWKEINEILDKE